MFEGRENSTTPDDCPRIVRLKINQIVTTVGTQVRAAIDLDTVAQYAVDMSVSADRFPPVVVYFNGAEFILADGFHRVMAASQNSFEDIEAEIRRGTKCDALRFSLSANASHGLRRTNADKRRSVEMALAEWPNLSSSEIGRICSVGHTLVDTVRREVQTDFDAGSRLGADGKVRRLPVINRGTLRSSALLLPASRGPEEPPGAADPSRIAGSDAASHAGEFDRAVGIPDAVNFFASQVEDIAEAVRDDASDAQLGMAIRQWRIEFQRLRQEYRRRSGSGSSDQTPPAH
jgi:hypothetical protein